MNGFLVMSNESDLRLEYIIYCGAVLPFLCLPQDVRAWGLANLLLYLRRSASLSSYHSLAETNTYKPTAFLSQKLTLSNLQSFYLRKQYFLHTVHTYVTNSLSISAFPRLIMAITDTF